MSKENLAALGRRLHALRDVGGWTQAYVAGLAGLDVQYYNRIERGNVNATYLTIIKVAEAMNVCPGALCAPSRNLINDVAVDVCTGVSHLCATRDLSGLEKTKVFLEQIVGVKCLCGHDHCAAVIAYRARKTRGGGKKSGGPRKPRAKNGRARE